MTGGAQPRLQRGDQLLPGSAQTDSGADSVAAAGECGDVQHDHAERAEAQTNRSGVFDLVFQVSAVAQTQLCPVPGIQLDTNTRELGLATSGQVFGFVGVDVKRTAEPVIAVSCTQ